MMRRLIGHQYDYGRLYNRTCIANIVARVCGRRAYGSNHDDDHTSTEEGDNYKLAEQLIDFAPSKWKKVIHQFTHLRDSLVRNDASLIVLPGEITEDDGGAGDGDNDEFIPQNDDGVNEAVASRQEFSKEYARMLDCMKFHACLSFIQPRLDKAIQSGSIEGVESVAIPHEDIIAFE